MKLDRKNLYVTKVKKENPYGFANWRLEEPVSGVTFSDRLAVQNRLIRGIPQII